MKLDEKKKNILSLVLLAAFFLLFTVSYFSDETVLILQKATAICMECIGIG